MSVIIDFNDIYEVKDQTGANIVSLQYGNDTIFTQERLFTVTLDPEVESAYLYIIPHGNVEPGRFFYWSGTEPNADFSNFDGEFTAGASNGQKIYGGVPFRLYRREPAPLSTSADDYHQIQLNANKYTVSGDLSSLIGFSKEIFTYCFRRLFYFQKVTDAKDLILPWGDMMPSCFDSMFIGCDQLTNTPAIEATRLAERCFEQMFGQCTALTRPANIYVKDGSGGNLSFYNMFQLCSGIKEVKIKSLEAYNNNLFYAMFWECKGLERAVIECPDTIPYENVFRQIFYNCSSLSNIKCNINEKNASRTQSIFNNWVSGVSEYGLFTTGGGSWNVGTNGIPEGWRVKSYDEDSFGIYIHEDGMISINHKGNIEKPAFLYWKNKPVDANKEMYDGTLTPDAGIPVAKGDIIRMIRFEKTQLHIDTDNYNIFKLPKCTLFGNLAALSGYCTDDELQQYHFARLFYYTNVVNAEDLIIPWSKVPQSCFEYLFEHCEALIKAPNLPATHCGSYTYRWMFKNCYLLEETPFIGLKTLNGEANCHQMFYGCTSLKRAVLPDIEKPVIYCFRQMLNGCTSLNYIECLLKTPSIDYTGNWVTNVPAGGTFIKAAGAVWPNGVSGIPAGWEVKDK